MSVQSTRKCRKPKPSYPSFTPVLTNLSTTRSAVGEYSTVYVTGHTFLPNGTTFVKFGGYGYVPCVYYSSFCVSFVVPSSVGSGTYPVQLVNVYNGNFSPEVNQSYPGQINVSLETIDYIIS